MKKVLFVINTMGRAGAEKSMIELMKSFDTKRFELYLLSLINRGEMFEYVPKHVQILNAKPDSNTVLSLRARLKIGKEILKKCFYQGSLFKNIGGLKDNWTFQRKSGRVQMDKLLWRIVSDGTVRIDQDFDGAIAYLEGGAAYYVADRVRAKTKMAYVHIDYKRAGYSPAMDKHCYEKMDQIFLVSEEARKSFLEIYPALEEKTKLFYNIIDAQEIKRLAQEKEGFTDSHDGIRLLTVGRLHYQKAYDIAIVVLSELLKRGYPVKWYVLGDGSIRKELEKQIEDYGVKEDFILLGAVSNPYPYIKECDIYVQISRYEGKSIAIEEAQVLGKAIVASNCTGNREQITNGVNGTLVELTVKNVVKGIEEVIDNPELRRKYEKANQQIDFESRKNMDLLYDLLEGSHERHTNRHSGLQ